jgi:hypothetical protein
MIFHYYSNWFVAQNCREDIVSGVDRRKKTWLFYQSSALFIPSRQVEAKMPDMQIWQQAEVLNMKLQRHRLFSKLEGSPRNFSRKTTKLGNKPYKTSNHSAEREATI